MVVLMQQMLVIITLGTPVLLLGWHKEFNIAGLELVKLLKT